jgi:deoxyadenosine/deoxycytidine kinase
VWKYDRVVISERSVFSDRLFWETKRRNGDVDDTLHGIYMNMWKKWQKLTPKESPDLFIYLDASLETCMQRLKERGRESESNVSWEYQRILKQVHDETFGGMDVEMPNGKRVPVLKVNCEIDYRENAKELKILIDTIVEKIREKKTHESYDQNMKYLNEYY